MTAIQNLIVAGVPADQKPHIEQLAREHGLIDDGVSEQRINSMARVAFQLVHWRWRKPSVFYLLCHGSGRYFGKTCVTKRREHHFACDGPPEWVRSSHVV